MNLSANRWLLVLVLVFLTGAQLVIARENQSANPSEEEAKVFVRNNQIFMRVKANEIVHRTGLFAASDCKIDDGLVVTFKDGIVTANTLGDGLMGGHVSGDVMMFHIGNQSCQITIQIQRRDGK
jgi:hypothetical protein